MNKRIFVLVVLYMFVSAIILTSVVTSNPILLNNELKSSQKIVENGEAFWKVTIIPEGNLTIVKLPPNYIITKSNIAPIKEESLVQTYIFGLFLSYQGKEITYDSNQPIEIIYKQMSNFEKFNSFFKLI